MPSFKLGEAFVEVRASLNKLSADLAAAERKIQSRLLQTSKRLQSVGNTLSTRVTLPLTLMGAGVVRTAFLFQKSMNRVAALTGATGKQFQEMTDLARRMGEVTEFSASQAADAMGFLAQAGFSVDDILQALPGTLQLASAGSLDLARAADIASNVLTQFKLKTSEIGRVNDVLALTASRSNTNVEQMAEALKFAGSVAATAGVSIEQTSAIIGLLGNAGLQGSIAGTVLARALLNLLNPTDQSKEALKKLGVTAIDSSGKLKPFVDILKQVEDAVLSGGVTAEETGRIFEAFGVRGGRAVASLLGQSEALRQFTRDLENAGGTAERIQKVQLRGLVGALARFRSALESAVLSVSESGFGGATERLLNRLSDLLRTVSRANPEILRFGTVIVTAAAAAAPALIGLALAFRGIAIILAVVLNRFVLFPTLLAGLVVAAIASFRALQDSLANLTVPSFEEFKTKFVEAFNAILSDIGDKLASAAESVSENLFGPLIGKVPDLKEGMDQASDSIKKAQDALKALTAAASEASETTASEVGSSMEEVDRAIQEVQIRLRLARGEFGNLEPEVVSLAAELNKLSLIDPTKIIGTELNSQTEQLIRKFEKLNELLKQLKKEQEENKDASNDFNSAAQQLGFTFSSALEDALVGARGFKDILRGLVQDIERIILRITVIEPIANSIKKSLSSSLGGGSTGGGGFLGSIFGTVGSFFSGIFGGAPSPTPLQLSGPFAKGGVFSKGVQKFAGGGVVSSPTLFPLRSSLGLMGEAGDEAILPLARLPGGQLGVQASGAVGGATVVINQQFDFKGASLEAVSLLKREANRIKSETLAAVSESAQRGGSMARLPRV